MSPLYSTFHLVGKPGPEVPKETSEAGYFGGAVVRD
jgi:hypothetical protein